MCTGIRRVPYSLLENCGRFETLCCDGKISSFDVIEPELKAIALHTSFRLIYDNNEMISIEKYNDSFDTLLYMLTGFSDVNISKEGTGTILHYIALHNNLAADMYIDSSPTAISFRMF